MIACSAQPTTYTEANATYALADVTMAGGDFMKSNGDTSGRKVTMGAKSSVLIDTSGLAPRDLVHLRRMAQKPYGLILVCGPTGSGKTTTLHSLIADISTESRKIWTAEDPIEITQAGLRQVQVNAKIDWTFAKALRAFLRADPDVIMVGEIRDEETAQMAIEASLTGHLVMSTDRKSVV